jgi:hypothetical protein
VTVKQIAVVVVACLLTLAAGYGAGRYVAPAKIITKTDIQWKDKIVYQDREVEKVVQGPTHTVTHTVVREVACKPGDTAPVSDTTTVVDAGPVTTDHTTAVDSTVVSTGEIKTQTVTVYEQPRLLLQAGAASGLDLKLRYNLGASYRLAGPLWAGAAYHLTDRRVEARVGLSF